MYRFARSEQVALKELFDEFVVLVGDAMPVWNLAKQTVPLGGIPDYPLLQALGDALRLEGLFSIYNDLVNSQPENVWISDVSSPPPPCARKNRQAEVLESICEWSEVQRSSQSYGGQTSYDPWD